MMILLETDIPNLTKEGIQMGYESICKVKELSSSSMIE